MEANGMEKGNCNTLQIWHQIGVRLLSGTDSSGSGGLMDVLGFGEFKNYEHLIALRRLVHG